MRLPILIDNRLRRFGAAVIGYMGAAAYGGAILWTMDGGKLSLRDGGFALLFAVLGALAAWFMIGWLGRPGWKGLARDLALAIMVLLMTSSLGMAGLVGPAAVLAPFIVLMSLAHPLTAGILCLGCVILLAYARLTAPKDPRPATSLRA